MNPAKSFVPTLALLALSAASLDARNVFVAPESPTSGDNLVVYSGTPLSEVATIPINVNVVGVFAKPTAEANQVRYYVISESGSLAIRAFSESFTQIGNALPTSQQIRAAGLSPDGRRLLVIGGNNLRVFNTEGDTLAEINIGFIDVGPNPNGIAFSPDSRRAYIVSPFQRMTAVDLTTNQAAGTIPLSLITEPPAIATGPNGFIYVSAQNRVLEVDPRITPLSTNAIRRTYTLPATANVGRLSFTPDGTRAIAVNRQRQTGLLFFFSLDHTRPPEVTTVSQNTSGFEGITFASVDVISNSRAYAVATNVSNPRQALVQVNLPNLAAAADPVPIPTIEQNFFAALGNIQIASSIAFSSEQPLPSRLYVAAPLKIIQPVADNTLYVINPTNNFSRIQDVTVAYTPGASFHAGPVSTSQQLDTPTSTIPLNQNQPVLIQGTRTLPFGVRVLGATGRPLFNQQVTFVPVSPGIQIDGPPSVNTNSDGYALNTVFAPNVPGPFTVRVAVSGSNLTRDFTFNAAGDTGGGNGGGQPGEAAIQIVQGGGQLIVEGDFAPKDLQVRLLDGQGQPLPDRQITWTVVSGAVNLQTGTGDFQTRATSTNSAGIAEMRVLSFGSLAPTPTVQFATITATAAGIGEATFELVVYPRLINSNSVPFPSVTYLAPTADPAVIEGRIGQTLQGAIRVRVQAPLVITGSPPIRNIGISVSTGQNPTQGPVAQCSPVANPLTGENGEATCNIRLTGRAGTSNMVVSVGEFSIRNIQLVALPGFAGGVRIISGNNQSGNPEQVLSPLTVSVDDGDPANTLPSIPVRWEVISGSATLTGPATANTGANGRATNTVRLGSTPGPVVIRATALSGNNPSATFTLQVNVTAANLQPVSGSGQTAQVNTTFPAALVVQANNAQGQPVQNVSVGFSVTTGSATLSSSSAITGADGRAQVSVTAGANAGPIVVTASLPGVGSVPFNLTATAAPPPPPPPADIEVLSVYNTAGGQRGAVVPGGIYTVVIRGYVPDLNGFIVANPVTGPLPTRLNDIEVQFGSSLAPIFHVGRWNGEETVTVQAPFELASGGEVWITVRLADRGAASLRVPAVLDYQPALFQHFDGEGRRVAVALRPDGSYVTPDNPARRGEIVRFFATGLGQASPLARTGVTGAPDQEVTGQVVFGVNGAGVRLVSATYAEGMIGVYELAVEIPVDAALRNDAPVDLLVRRPTGEPAFGAGSIIPIAPAP